MGVNTIVTCDKCGKTKDSNSNEWQPVAVGLSIQFGQTRVTHYPTHECQEVWCRECVMKAGLYNPITDEDKKVAPNTPPSFEEKIVGLFESLGFIREY